MERVEGFRIPSADVHGLRELMQQLLALEDEITPDGYLEIKHLVRKIDRILSGAGS
jgi:hypothetical protein